MTSENKSTTADIVVVMDESGSMTVMGKEPMEAMNQFIAEQKKNTVDPTTQLSLYLFSNRIRKIHTNAPLQTVPEFNDYNPSGMTALFDAVGQAINDKLNTERNKNVILVVITDGEENASREYTTKKEISSLIKKVEDEHKWQVMFLGANIDAFSEGASMNVRSGHCVQYSQNTRGALKKALKTTSDAANYYRHAAYCGSAPTELNLSEMNDSS